MDTTGKAAYSKSVRIATLAAPQAATVVVADLAEALAVVVATEEDMMAVTEVAAVTAAVEATVEASEVAGAALVEATVVAVDMAEVASGVEVALVPVKGLLLLSPPLQTHSQTTLHQAPSPGQSSTCAT